MKKTRVVVGLSGGVDSSVAAYLLKEQGYDVVGLFMRNWHDTTGTLEGDCPWYDDNVFAELTARKLDIPFHMIDLSEEYRRRVVDYMFAEYGRGRTPNPDVLCNREIKFDAFLKAALELGADFVATGHYCRREEVECDGRRYHRLLAGSDPNKDQSYFLCQLSQEQLSRALFPIGHLLKAQVRRIAAEQHLATATRKDSQGICFVGKVDLPIFLQQQLKAKTGPIVEIPVAWSGYGSGAAEEVSGQRLAAAGAFQQALLPSGTDRAQASSQEVSSIEQLRALDTARLQQALETLSEPWHYTAAEGVRVGEHRGAHFYTVGQRKGLNVGGKSEPLFVLSSDVERNILYVGMGQGHPGLYRRALRITPEEMHWIRPDRAFVPGENGRFSMRIRYRQPLQQGALFVTEKGGYIVFDRPQRGITAGQFAAWYDDQELIGSGVIDR